MVKIPKRRHPNVRMTPFFMTYQSNLLFWGIFKAINGMKYKFFYHLNESILIWLDRSSRTISNE